MSGYKRRRHNKKVFGKSFIILPIIFFIGIIVCVYVSLAPSFGALISSSEIIFSDGEKNYSTEYKNIYVPVEQNETVAVVTNDNNEEVVAEDSVEYPNYGNQFGEIEIPGCDIKCPLFMGDGETALRNGVGIYYGSFVPGYGSTTMIAGHNNTYFNGLKYAEKGQEGIIRTSYGNYRYKIVDTAVKDALDSSAYDLSADHENLVMYTCYPFDEIGLTSKRYFVYADLVEGMPIEKRSE